MDKQVAISKEEYDRLVEDSEFLECCQVCGLDNWEGLQMAIDMFLGGD